MAVENRGFTTTDGIDLNEVYYNTGRAESTFAQIEGAVNTSRGLAAVHAIGEEDNSLFILGDDRIVYRFDGYTSTRISDFGVESDIQGFEIVSDAFMFVFTEFGHKFLVITFPAAQRTWCYDIAQRLWHRRESVGLGRWRPNCHAFFAGKNLVGDCESGKIFAIDPDAYTENGALIIKKAKTNSLSKDKKRLIHNKLEIDFDAGRGLAVGQGSDPFCILRYSDDGGITWSSEKWRSIGKIGEYTRRAVWRRLGVARERVYELAISEPIKTVVTGAYLDVVELDA
jgi:hypothetical protein